MRLFVIISGLNLTDPATGKNKHYHIRMSASTQRQSSHQSDPPQVMTIDDLASYLQVAKSTLYKLAQEGKVPGQKVGKHWRFRKDTINRWLDEQGKTRKERGT